MSPGEDQRLVMRRVPHGVAVVTVDADGQRLGLREAGSFALSVLAGDQEALAQHFARGVPPIALWHGIELRAGDGPPLLAGALGWLRCRTAAEHAAGDHTLFLGEVEWAEGGEPRPPLVHVDGRYRAL